MFHNFKLKVFLSPFTPLHSLSAKAVTGTPQNHTPLIPALFLPSPFARCSSLWDKHRVKRGKRAASYPTDRMVSKVSKKGFSEVTDPNKFFIACKKSRIENNTSFYGCFYLGPFDESLSQTLANDLRRTLLSELVGLAITSVEIEGVLHKFSSLPGLKEPVLDFICNLQTVVLKKSGGPIKPLPPEKPILRLSADTLCRGTKKTYTGFLKVRGPRVIKARDLKLPAGILCVDPNQYIATLAEDGILNMKFHINQGKSYVFQKPQNFDVTNLKKRNILLHKTKKYKSLLNSNLVSSQTLEFMKDPNKKTVFLTTQKDNSNTVLPKKELGENLPAVSSVSFPLQPITLDAVFMPVTKVNCIIDDNNLATDFNIFKKLQASVPEHLSIRLPGLSSQENPLKKGAGSEYPNFIPFTSNPPGGITSLGDLVKGGTGLEGAFHSFLLSPQGGLAHRGHFPTLDSITNADVQAERQTSLFFNNAFCLYKNNLKLNKLYSQIKQQTKLKLIPWYENLSYFNFGNFSVRSVSSVSIVSVALSPVGGSRADNALSPLPPFTSNPRGITSTGGLGGSRADKATSTNIVPSAFYSFLLSPEKGLSKGANLTQQIKRRGTYSPSNIRLLSTNYPPRGISKAFSFNKINRIKPLLGSYNFYTYNLSKIHHAKPLSIIYHHAQAKQEFKLPIVAKKLLYPEKYSILPPVLAVPERACFVRGGSLVSSVTCYPRMGISKAPSNNADNALSPYALPLHSVWVKRLKRGLREPALPFPTDTAIPLNYPLQGLTKASSFYLDLSPPSKVPLHSVSPYPPRGIATKLQSKASYPVGGKGFSGGQRGLQHFVRVKSVKGDLAKGSPFGGKGDNQKHFVLGQSPLPKEGLGALSAVVTAKVHKKNSRTEYVLGEKASDTANLTPALADLSYLRGISKGDKVYSRRFAGKVYSYQDLLNIEYSKILKLKPLIKKCHLILEIWTNGSIHPRQALYNSFRFLTNTFLKLQKVKPLGSMFRSELAYGNINKYYTPYPPRGISKAPYTNTLTNYALSATLTEVVSPSGGIRQGRNTNPPKGGLVNAIHVGNLEVGSGEYSKQIVQKRGLESQELPIGVLPISLRAYTALRKAEIFTLNHLLNYSKGELLKLKNFGPKSLFEVEKTLADLGLSLYP